MDKICSTCKEVKDTSDFFKDSCRPDGYEYNCKLCAMKKKQNNDYRKKYGITSLEFEAMSIARDHKCDICGKTKAGVRIDKLCVDHCHATGKVRGLLCELCNRALGQFKDNPEALRKAADYVEKSK